MCVKIYSLTSSLHDETTVSEATKEFLGRLNVEYVFKGGDFSDYGSVGLDVIYVRTGGTEGIFRQLLPMLREKSSNPFYLLASDKSNSLAASMEILSFLRQLGMKGEIIHGSADYISERLKIIEKVYDAQLKISGKRLGIIGKPSDWLISSIADKDVVRARLGVELIDMEMDKLIEIIGSLKEQTLTPPTFPGQTDSMPEKVSNALPGAWGIYLALKHVVHQHRLDGFTIRCFDLLSSVHNTGCLALARLNSEGVVSSCEGDVPAMLSMLISQALTGVMGFQSNPARIDPQSGEMLFAHCTIPFNMVNRFEFDTHFESGIGVGIRGYIDDSDVTIFKVSADLTRYFAEEGKLLCCQSNPGLCRTQMSILLDNPSTTNYFLTEPIGNHHIIIPGRHKSIISQFMHNL